MNCLTIVLYVFLLLILTEYTATLDDPMGKHFMEYNFEMEKRNNEWRWLDDKLRKKQENTRPKRSRMAAKKVFMANKNNKKRNRMKLKLDTKSMITDIGYYC